MAENDSKSPTYLLVQEKVGQETIEWLRAQRGPDDSAPDKSWRGISLELYREHGLDITEVTLRKWWADAHAEPEPAAT